MKIIIKVLRGVLGMILCAVIVANAWLLIQQAVLKKDAPELFGYAQFIVTSGSMEPSFSAGDMVLTKEKENYEMGDIVTFRDSRGALVTHRIVGTVSNQFITKGDANNAEDDELLAPAWIVGEVEAVLPGIGSTVLFFRSPLGLLILLVVGVLLIELPSWTGALKTRAKGKHAHESER